MTEAASNKDRTNAQNVAICLSAWREKHPEDKPPEDKAESGMLIKGEMSWELASTGPAPERVLYMPAGEHTIFCRVNGEPREIEVHVDAATAELLQADLEDLLTQDVKPFIDYNHEGKAAAATPVRFTWVEGDGLYLELDWSRSGKENIEGKDFKHFSPTFQIDKDGHPTGLPETGPIGALVNNPAFRQQKEILDQIAAELAADNNPKPKPKTMIVEAKGLKALAKELFGDDAPDDDDDQMPEKILKKIKAMKKSLQDAEAKAKKAADDADDANAKKEDAEAQLVELKQSKATAAVDAVIAAGKMPGKDEKTRKFYVESYLRDPAGTQHVLDSLGPRGAFKPIVKVDGADRRDIGAQRVAAEAAEGQRDADRAQMMAQRALIAKVKLQHPGLDTDSVMVLARQEYPDAFVEA
jgi:phage I-like protein